MRLLGLCLQKSVIWGPHGLTWWSACRVTICRCSRWYGRWQLHKNISLLCRDWPTSKRWFHSRACVRESVAWASMVTSNCRHIVFTHSMKNQHQLVVFVDMYNTLRNHNITGKLTFCCALKFIARIFFPIHRWFAEIRRKRKKKKRKKEYAVDSETGWRKSPSADFRF